MKLRISVPLVVVALAACSGGGDVDGTASTDGAPAAESPSPDSTPAVDPVPPNVPDASHDEAATSGPGEVESYEDCMEQANAPGAEATRDVIARACARLPDAPR